MYMYCYNIDSVSDVIFLALLSVSTAFFLGLVLCLLCTNIRAVIRDTNISSCMVVSPETNWLFEYSTAGKIRKDLLWVTELHVFLVYTLEKRNYKTV